MAFGQLAGRLVALLFICPDEAADVSRFRRRLLDRRVIRHEAQHMPNAVQANRKPTRAFRVPAALMPQASAGTQLPA